jgi:hypothetical protein
MIISKNVKGRKGIIVIEMLIMITYFSGDRL